jgi:hypothetical protein
MDAIEERVFQSDVFKQNDLILIHCILHEHHFMFTIPCIPLLRWKGIICHFSFANFPSRRRICVMPLSEAILLKFRDIHSPCFARVKSSVLFKVSRLNGFISCYLKATDYIKLQHVYNYSNIYYKNIQI